MEVTYEDAAFERRLDSASASPVAVAVSGGADSVLALIATVKWAQARGRRVLALNVDHQLQPDSRIWSAFVRDQARRLEADFSALVWSQEKPTTGLPAAARAARHRLLARAARSAGAQVLVFGHTADDARENALLGQGGLSEWTPSPVWPQGRGVFILRPLLGLGRAAVRQTLMDLGQSWIDDPANDDFRHPRVRVRHSTAEAKLAAIPPSIDDLARQVTAANGAFQLSRKWLLSLDPPAARRLLAAALTCAGGGERPAGADRVNALLARLQQAGEVKATLAGARCVAGDQVLILRDVGEKRRGRLAVLDLEAGVPSVWDGRYEIEVNRLGLSVDIAQGHMSRLPKDQGAALAAVPAVVRPALPVILGLEAPTCPTLAPSNRPVCLRDLTATRFLAACGAIARETELAQGAHGATGEGVLCSSSVMK